MIKHIVIIVLITVNVINVSNARPDSITPKLTNLNVQIKPSVANKGAPVNSRDVKRMPEVVFPDSDILGNHTLSKRAFKPGQKKCNETFCMEADDYPEDYINDIISKSVTFEKYFKTRPNVSLNSRFGVPEVDLEPELETLCDAHGSVQFPRTATNIEKNDVFLVNTKDYKQGVVIYKCKNEGNTCKFAENFPIRYTTECTQRYVVKRLMALKDDGKPDFDEFDIPTCCVCSLKKKLR